MRLTLALDFKLARDASREAREEAREEEAQAAQAAHLAMTDPTPAETQKRRVRGVLNRLLWDESEGDQEEYDVLLEDLDARLSEVEDAPHFADLPIEVLAQTLKADMRLAGDLVVTTASRLVPANTPRPPLADTG